MTNIFWGTIHKTHTGPYFNSTAKELKCIDRVGGSMAMLLL